MSLTLSQRFRNLAEQYNAVLEHWRSFSELVTLGSPDRYRKAIDAWDGFKQAFLTAASTLAELRGDVPPEVANLWIGPTAWVPVYSGALRVGESLDLQVRFFQAWLPRVSGAVDFGWVWRADFYRDVEQLEWYKRELEKCARVCESWNRKQEAQKIVKALQQPNPLKNCDQAEAVTTRPENPSATREETAQTPVAGDVPGNQSNRKGRKRGDWVIKALELLEDNPQLSDRQIAQIIGVNPSTLCKNEKYSRGAQCIRGEGRVSQGFKTREGKTDAIAPPDEDD